MNKNFRHIQTLSLLAQCKHFFSQIQTAAHTISKTLRACIWLSVFALQLSSFSIAYALDPESPDNKPTNLTQDPAVRQFAQKLSDQYHISTSYIYATLSKTHFTPDVIAKMNQPYEAKSWREYHKLFVTKERVEQGVLFWYKNRDVLAQVEKTYGIPADVIVAIIGIETKYGTEMGKFPVLDALSTLAFYYPSRAEFFQKELGSLFMLCYIQHLDPASLKGSYAGAMGMAQFMPSTYLFYGKSYSGSKQVNLFDKDEDAITSIANYLMQEGWERDEPIALPALIKEKKFETILKKDSRKPEEPSLTIEKLAEYQVYSNDPQESRINGYWKANLMYFEGDKIPYWLGLNNFYVLTLYNNSDQYAMSVFRLGKALQQAYRNYLSNKAKENKLTDTMHQG